MRIALALVVCLAACSKKSGGEGLPPASEWGANAGSANAAAKTPDIEPPPPGMVPMGMEPKANDSLPPGHPPIAGSGQAGDDNHPPVAPQPTQPKTLDKLADGRLGLGPMSLQIPDGWSEVPTTSDMRAAQFKVGADAELVVFYFGQDGAGSVQDNLDRWANQFTQPDGKPSTSVAKIEKTKILDQEATIMFVTGNFGGMQMPGMTAQPAKNDQALLAAITASPSGPYYWKLTGGKATVAANDAKFRALLTGLKLK